MIFILKISIQLLNFKNKMFKQLLIKIMYKIKIFKKYTLLKENKMIFRLKILIH